MVKQALLLLGIQYFNIQGVQIKVELRHNEHLPALIKDFVLIGDVREILSYLTWLGL